MSTHDLEKLIERTQVNPELIDIDEIRYLGKTLSDYRSRERQNTREYRRERLGWFSWAAAVLLGLAIFGYFANSCYGGCHQADMETTQRYEECITEGVLNRCDCQYLYFTVRTADCEREESKE